VKKKSANFQIGLEYERVPIFNNSNIEADYASNDGICNFLRDIAKNCNWDYIVDNTNGNMIGLKKMHDTITLEPGCQVELSIKPEKHISDLKNKIETLDDLMWVYLKTHGINLLNYGISPVTTYNSITLIPKKRYHLMAKYMWGILSDVMMRETAGIQCGIDFSSEEDMAKKFNIAQKLSPFMTAMYANSPIRGGVDTGYKSFRALSWLNTDNDRCGFANKFENDFTYRDYIEKVLKTPMIFINRNDDTINLNGKINFNDFMNSPNYTATMEDFELQANLYFPEVRLRNFIEIRNHDCVNKNLMWSIPAIYQGIMYNPSALQDMEEFLKPFSFEEISELRYSIPKYALDSEIKGIKVSDIAREILNIAEKSLKEFSPQDVKYLDGIKELISQKMTPADVILKNWYGSWNKDINKLIEFAKN
jgi:glutamate--cysteine ligase